MKILTVLGARPQFVKSGALSRYIKENTDITEHILHTGQHYDKNMSDIFFSELDIPQPKYQLNISNTSHGQMTALMVIEIEKILMKDNYDYLLVFGDTNSTLAGALAAVKLSIPILHVEAGLRSFNMSMPEEINRILTDRISSKLYCPTPVAVSNLYKEGISGNNSVYLTGDIMKDVSLYYKDKGRELNSVSSLSKFALCTLHRAENTNNPTVFLNILNAINAVSLNINVVIPLHPRTKKIIENLGFVFSPKVSIIEPVGYLNMTWLLKNCEFVITDSGGLQKEAYFFNKICYTLREETEWVELVDNKVNYLVGSNKELLLDSISEQKDIDFSSISLYGQGNTSEEIIKSLY